MSNGDSKEKLCTKLTKLKEEHKYMYEFLNAIADVVIKPIPLTMWMVISLSDSIQNFIAFIFIVVYAHVMAMTIYIIIMFGIQIYKLLFSFDRSIDVRIRILDILIDIGEGTFFSKIKGNSKMYRRPKQEIFKEREENYKNSLKKNEEELEKLKIKLEKTKQSYEDYRNREEYLRKKAREGGAFLESPEQMLKEADRCSVAASFCIQDMNKYKQKIENLERALRRVYNN